MNGMVPPRHLFQLALQSSYDSLVKASYDDSFLFSQQYCPLSIDVGTYLNNKPREIIVLQNFLYQ